MTTRIIVVAMAVTVMGPGTGFGQASLAPVASEFWTHPDSATRSYAAQQLARLPFADVFAAVKAGPQYTAKPTGRIIRQHRIDGVRHPYFVVIPESYAPSRAYPVRFFLHGGVQRAEWDSNGQWWRRWEALASDDYIGVFPAAWSASPWWTPVQLHNLRAILATLTREYHLDHNRVHLFGVSDGGTGSYYAAFQDPQPWAGFVPLIGHPAVLNNPRLRVPGELFLANLTNRPFFIANGETDRLYPAESMREFVDIFANEGVDLTFQPQPGGHSVSWWPDIASDINGFLNTRPRQPHPAELSFESVGTPFNRLHWIRIDSISPGAAVQRRQLDPFPHDRPSGRVDAAYRNNEIRIVTRDVHRLTVLLSPDVFDFSRPIIITLNGRPVFRRPVDASVTTLLQWATVDGDPTMLYAAEVTLTVPRR